MRAERLFEIGDVPVRRWNSLAIERGDEQGRDIHDPQAIQDGVGQPAWQQDIDERYIRDESAIQPCERGRHVESMAYHSDAGGGQCVRQGGRQHGLVFDQEYVQWLGVFVGHKY